MNKFVTDLAAIRASDEYLDILGVGETLPPEWQDQLSYVLASWVKEVRGVPWTLPPLQLPGF